MLCDEWQYLGDPIVLEQCPGQVELLQGDRCLIGQALLVLRHLREQASTAVLGQYTVPCKN